MVDGTIWPISIALIDLRVTPIRSASSACVKLCMARWIFKLVFSSSLIALLYGGTVIDRFALLNFASFTVPVECERCVEAKSYAETQRGNQ